jgi:hypothetical protein
VPFPVPRLYQQYARGEKRNTKRNTAGVRGWTVKTENNIFGGSSFLWNTPGSAWYAQNIWEHYAFTKDKAYLKNFGYPILKEIGVLGRSFKTPPGWYAGIAPGLVARAWAYRRWRNVRSGNCLRPVYQLY